MLLARKDLFDAGRFAADGVDACFGRLTTLNALSTLLLRQWITASRRQCRAPLCTSIKLLVFVEDHYLGDESVQVADVSQAMLGGKRGEVFV